MHDETLKKQWKKRLSVRTSWKMDSTHLRKAGSANGISEALLLLYLWINNSYWDLLGHAT
jgi:hypothetical protein